MMHLSLIHVLVVIRMARVGVVWRAQSVFIAEIIRDDTTIHHRPSSTTFYR
jgi:hypothetical protein